MDASPDVPTDTGSDTPTDTALDIPSPDPDREPIWTQEVCTENLLDSLEAIIDECEETLDTR